MTSVELNARETARALLTSFLYVCLMVVTVLPGLVSAREITNVEEVLKISASELSREPVDARLLGVVLYVSPSTRRLYVQGGEYCVQVNCSMAVTNFDYGQLVEVAGRIEAAQPAPHLIGASARVLGTAPLPEPAPSSAHRFQLGQDMIRYVKVRGVVRDMTLDEGKLYLLLTSEGIPFEHGILSATDALPRDWLDAEIEAKGFAFPFYTPAGKQNGYRFHSPDMSFLQVIHPGTSNLFDRPLLTIAEASRRPREWQPRIKIAGTVTMHRGPDIYVDDGTGVMQINPISLLPKPAKAESLPHAKQVPLQPGDRVEVIGVRQNWFSLAPMLLHAEYRRIGSGPPVKPVTVTISDLKAGRQAGKLVSIDAKLLNQRTWSERLVHRHLMMLQAGDEVFQASWYGDRPVEWNSKLDSYLRVTGVNDAQSGQLKDRITFELLLRGAEDVVPIPEPPFWTKSSFRKPVLAGSSVAAVAGALIFLQRRQMRRLRSLNEEWERRVQNRTAELQVALQAEKELSQLKSSFVSMVSHEFRTPLEVVLSSSDILDRYLDRLPPDKRAAQLRAIRKSVHRMNDLIEDVLLLGKLDAGALSCQPVGLDLISLCRRAVEEIESASARPGIIQFSGDDHARQASADEPLLLHILTNLLGNAVKYSPATSPVEFTLERRNMEAVFTFRDHGCGIPARDQPRLFTAFYRGSNVGKTSGSGLGLVVVKRCVDLHAGSIRCESVEGKGTTFVVTLPLFDGTRHFRRRTAGEESENGL